MSVALGKVPDADEKKSVSSEQHSTLNSHVKAKRVTFGGFIHSFMRPHRRREETSGQRYTVTRAYD